MCDGIDDRHDLVGAVDHRLNERGRLCCRGRRGLLGGDVAGRRQELTPAANGDKSRGHRSPLADSGDRLKFRHKISHPPVGQEQLIKALAIGRIPPQVEFTSGATHHVLRTQPRQARERVIHLDDLARLGVDDEHGIGMLTEQFGQLLSTGVEFEHCCAQTRLLTVVPRQHDRGDDHGGHAADNPSCPQVKQPIRLAVEGRDKTGHQGFKKQQERPVERHEHDADIPRSASLKHQGQQDQRERIEGDAAARAGIREVGEVQQHLQRHHQLHHVVPAPDRLPM